MQNCIIIPLPIPFFFIDLPLFFARQDLLNKCDPPPPPLKTDVTCLLYKFHESFECVNC